MQPDEQQPQQIPQASPQAYQSLPPQPAPAEPVVNPVVQPLSVQSDIPQTTPIESEQEPATDTNLLEPIHWQATEYVHREKNQLWFIIFGVTVLVLILVAIFIIKSFSFAILVPVMAAALFVYTRRPPRLFDYTLSRQGLHINDQLYPYTEFKSFAVVHGIDHYAVMFIPTKRFKPAVSVNFPEEAGEGIVDMLAPRLPMREMELDLIGRIIQKLHI